jgi:hypothetical protein
VNGGYRLLAFSGQPVSAVPGPAAIGVILAFLLTDVLLGVLQLLEQVEQRQIEPDVWL